jgi:hypothetical protein
MFNREYQRRASRQALSNLGAGLVRDDSQFYRPARRTRPGVAAKQCKKRSGKLQGLQLELFPDTQSLNSRVPDPARPLGDLFPEAYE